MKSLVSSVVLILAILVMSSACSSAADAPAAATQPALTTLMEKVSYAIGTNMGEEMRKMNVEIDPAILAKGLSDALAGRKLAMTPDQMQQTMMEFEKEMMAKEAAKAKAAGEKNKKAGEAFLAANKSKEGVKTTASGLQYKELKAGSGDSPKATDVVTVNYKGTLIDGTVFDSSDAHGEPAMFQANRVIKGWTEALQLMKVGSKFQLFIPSELAYGSDPQPGSPIEPDSVLVFEVELLKITPGVVPTTQPDDR